MFHELKNESEERHTLMHMSFIHVTVSYTNRHLFETALLAWLLCAKQSSSPLLSSRSSCTRRKRSFHVGVQDEIADNGRVNGRLGVESTAAVKTRRQGTDF